MKLYSSPEMLPTVLDNDKMNIDDEAMTKLLEQLCQQHSDQQPMKICPPPQQTMPVTGQLSLLKCFSSNEG